MAAIQSHIMLQVGTTDMGHIASKVLNFTERQIIYVHTNGWSYVNYFYGFNPTGVMYWFRTVENIVQALGGNKLGSLVANRLQLLNHWIKNNLGCVNGTTVSNFNIEEVFKAINWYALYIQAK